MAIVIALLIFIFMVGAITWYGSRVYLRAGRVYEQVDRAGQLPTDLPFTQDAKPDGLVLRVVRQIGEKVPVSPAEASVTRRYLMAAGFRSAKALAVFNGAKIATTVILVLIALATRNHVTSNVTMGWIVVMSAGLAGWFGPGVVLDRLVSSRQMAIRLGLPDALDMMVICVEAGHALDQAFVRVSKELKITHPAICEEFSMVTLEMRAGKRRSEALHNLASRSGEEEL